MNTEEALRDTLQAIVDDHDRRVTPDWMGRIAAARAALALPTSAPPVPTVSEAPSVPPVPADSLDVIAAWRCVADLAWAAALKESDCNGEDELLAQRRWQRRAIQIIAAHVEASLPAVPRVPTDSAYRKCGQPGCSICDPDH